MWVITVFLNESMKMYEYESEKEARQAIRNLKGNKFLSEIVYELDCFYV